MTKVCKKCGLELPIEEFHMRVEGYRRGSCNSCRRAYHNAFESSPVQRARQAVYRRNNREIFNRHNVAYRKRNRPKLNAYMRKKRAENSLMSAAHAKVAYALRRGVLQKKPCEMCGAVPAHAHHADYSKPLDVIWLCHYHHKQIHLQEAHHDTNP